MAGKIICPFGCHDWVRSGSAFLGCVTRARGKVKWMSGSRRRPGGGEVGSPGEREGGSSREEWAGEALGEGEELCDARLSKYKKYHFITL